MFVSFPNLNDIVFLQLTVNGLRGLIFLGVVLLVGKENKSEHEHVPTHLPLVAELIARDLPWKR